MAMPQATRRRQTANSSAMPTIDPDADGGLSVDINTIADPIDLGGASMVPSSDGGAEVDLSPQTGGASVNAQDFNANLAFLMDEGDLDGLGSAEVDKIEADDASRDEWKDTIAEGIELLGFRIEDIVYPFPEASDAYSPVMSKATYRNWAKSMAMLLPPAGPCRSEIMGAKNQDLEDQATRKAQFMNLYLTSLDKSYYPDTTQMLWWWTLVGSTFKKVYQCPLKKRPLSPFIRPENFITGYTTTNIYTAQRLTHQFFPTPREIALMQAQGLWLPGDTDGTGLDLSTDDNTITRASDEAEGLDRQTAQMTSTLDDSTQPFLEEHADLDLGEMGIDGKPAWEVLGTPKGVPVPLRLIITKEDRKVLAVFRNWRKGDLVFDRRNRFVHYKLLPGPGFYGAGYAHLLGNVSRTGTGLRRQMTDGITLNLFPGGIRDANMKVENNNILIAPGEWVPVVTGGVPLQDIFKTMPYKDLQPTQLQFLQYVEAGADDLANTAEIAVGEGRQDAPVGTTLALQEAATVIATAMIREGHVAQKEEFALIAEEFGENLPEGQPYPFQVAGQDLVIMKSDFQNNIQVVPVSDPNITSNAQRVGRAEIKIRMAGQAPQLHDMRPLYQDFYAALGDSSEAIMRYLPPPNQAQPLDPLSENQLAILQSPITAGETQDHAAHIQAHMALAELPAMQAHIGQHMAFQMRVQVERILGQTLPPAGTKLPPQIEDTIARMTAQAMKQLMDEQNPPEPTAAEIAMADIQVKQAGVEQKHNSDLIRASVDAFREQMRGYIVDKQLAAKKEIVLIQSAADAFDNRTPEVAQVKELLQMAEMLNIPGIGKNGGVDAHVKVKTTAQREKQLAQKPVNGGGGNGGNGG